MIRTWLVHTLLKVTKAKVWASMVDGRSFLASRSGRAMAERKSCGMKARDSRFMDRDGDGEEEGLSGVVEEDEEER